MKELPGEGRDFLEKPEDTDEIPVPCILLSGGLGGSQGYLAHKKPRPLRTLQ